MVYPNLKMKPLPLCSEFLPPLFHSPSQCHLEEAGHLSPLEFQPLSSFSFLLAPRHHPGPAGQRRTGPL